MAQTQFVDIRLRIRKLVKQFNRDIETITYDLGVGGNLSDLKANRELLDDTFKKIKSEINDSIGLLYQEKLKSENNDFVEISEENADEPFTLEKDIYEIMRNAGTKGENDEDYTMVGVPLVRSNMYTEEQVNSRARGPELYEKSAYTIPVDNFSYSTVLPAFKSIDSNVILFTAPTISFPKSTTSIEDVD